MYPILFQIGSVTIYTYGVLAAVGFLLGLWYAYHRAPRVGLDPNRVWNLGIYGILIALGTSKIWLILSDWDYFSANPRQIFSIATFQSAGMFYGGMLGGLLWVILYTHFQKMSASRGPRSGGGSGCARPRYRSPRMLRRRLLLRQADAASMGRHVHQSCRRKDQRHSVGRFAASHPALRIRG